jgi:hypothetical protein
MIDLICFLITSVKCRLFSFQLNEFTVRQFQQTPLAGRAGSPQSSPTFHLNATSVTMSVSCLAFSTRQNLVLHSFS